jgi:hypothetical protein
LLWTYVDNSWNEYRSEDWYYQVDRYEDSCSKSIIILKGDLVNRVAIIRPKLFPSFFDISAGKLEQINKNEMLFTASFYAITGVAGEIYSDTYVIADSAILNLKNSSMVFFEGYETGPIRGMYAQTFKEGSLI